MKKLFGIFLHFISFLLVVTGFGFLLFVFILDMKDKSFLLMFSIIYILLGVGAYYWGKYLQKD